MYTTYVAIQRDAPWSGLCASTDDPDNKALWSILPLSSACFPKVNRTTGGRDLLGNVDDRLASRARPRNQLATEILDPSFPQVPTILLPLAHDSKLELVDCQVTLIFFVAMFFDRVLWIECRFASSRVLLGQSSPAAARIGLAEVDRGPRSKRV